MIRNGQVKPLDLAVILEPLGPGTTVTTQYLKDSLAYLRVRYFNDDTPRDLEKALKSLKRHRPPVKGLVLDLRNNARGTMEQAVRTGSVLLGEKEIVSAKGRAAKTAETFQGKGRDLVFKTALPMVVLVDQGTARAAEILAGALRDQSQATLLGAKTLGLCGLTKILPLQDGSALIMTVAQCYTPKGQKIQGKGLDPEITGKAPAEMERNRDRGFCCGAGGGRMWMEEKVGKLINVARVEEALEKKPETICVCCPYCMTMFDDGLKDKEAADKVQVLDLAEIVAKALPE